MFRVMHAREERVQIVVLQDGDRFLRDDRPVVDLLVDQVHRDPGDLHTPLERIGHRAHPGEGGQERGVQVDDAFGEGGDELGPDDPHVARQREAVDALGLEQVAERPVVRGSVGEVLRLTDGGLDAATPRPLQRHRLRPVRDHERHVRADDRIVHEGLEVRARPGGEHREASVHIAPR